jgi:DNA-binding transcriptional LysR family regulator
LLHEEHHLQWEAWFAANGLCVSGSLGGQLHWHAHLAIAAARQGRGLALANRYLLAEDLAAGSLVEVKVPGCRPARIGSYCLVAREDRWQEPAIARLRHFLAARIAEETGEPMPPVQALASMPGR